MARGFQASAILLTALEIGVFSELGKGPRQVEPLAEALGVGALRLREDMEGWLLGAGLDLARVLELESTPDSHVIIGRKPA